jgi:hypothetical protein
VGAALREVLDPAFRASRTQRDDRTVRDARERRGDDEVREPVDADARRADGMREVQRSGVVRHDHLRAGEQGGEPLQRKQAARVHRRRAHGRDDARGERPFLRGAVHHHERAGLRKRIAYGGEALRRPAPAGIGGARLQHRERRLRQRQRARELRAITVQHAEARGAVGRARAGARAGLE